MVKNDVRIFRRISVGIFKGMDVDKVSNKVSVIKGSKADRMK